VDVVAVVDRINRWHLSAFRGYHFNKWISLGDIVRFNERIADGDVQVYVDPVQVKKRGANALYEDCVGVGCSTYFNDIVLADTLDKVPAQTLWHEVMHAIFDAHDSELLVSNDEIYAWYAEGVINVPLQALTRYEKELQKGEACDQGRLDQLWSMFERRMQEARNTVEGPITSDAQIEQLRQLTGFHVDVATIRQGYVDAGLDKCSAVTPTVISPGKPDATLSDLDLIFCIDVTGSMEDDIAGVKAAASNIVNTIAARSKNYRVAIIAYRDWEDSLGLPMFEDYGFSSDKEAIIANINSLSVGGGDDTPEAVFEALMRAIDSKVVGGWRSNVNKQVILMGDAPPHNPSRQGFTPATVARAAEEADPVVIQALVVGNDGIYDTEAVEAFRELAELTGGNFLEAADASKVPEVLQETIEVIKVPRSTSLLSRTSVLLIGGGCVLLSVLGGIVAVVILLLGRKPRRATYPPMPPGGVPPYGTAQAYPPYPSQPAGSQYRSPVPPQHAAPRVAPSPPGHWQGKTMLSPSMNVAELVIEAGMDAGQRFPLTAHTRLGRAADNDIVLHDPQASRHHAVISFGGAEHAIIDLGSANGTRVNGVQIQQPCPLHHGDLIAIGSERLRLQQR